MPVTTTGLALLYAGSALNSSYSSLQQGKAAKAQANYEASMLERNAEFAAQRAQDAIDIGKDQESRHLAEVRKLIGEQRTTIAGSGVDISSGSARDIQEESAFLGELDRATIANNARREAWGFKMEAYNYRNQAKLTRAGGRNAAASYQNQAISTLIGGAAEVGSLYRKGR